jgi:hypothetical protein
MFFPPPISNISPGISLLFSIYFFIFYRLPILFPFSLMFFFIFSPFSELFLSSAVILLVYHLDEGSVF